MDPYRGKLVNTILISVLVSGWGIIHLYSLPYWCRVILDIPLWLFIGTLMWSGTHISSFITKLSISNFIVGFAFSWGLMTFLIFLPALFPIFKQNSFGIKINFQNSPAVLIASISFLLGYCMQVTMKVPPAGWQRTLSAGWQRTLFLLKNCRDGWRDFGNLLFFSLGVGPQSFHR